MERTNKFSRADRRKQILQEATRLFARNGFRGVTTRELSKAVGVTEPVLYEHFQAKSELYSALINEGAQERFAKFDRQMREWAETSDPRVYFGNVAKSIVRFLEKEPDYMRLVLFSALERHELADLSFNCHARPLYQMIAVYIQRLIAAGTFRAMDPQVAARGFMGMMMHYALFDVHFGFTMIRTSRKKTIEQLVDIYVTGMERPPKGKKNA